MQSQDELEDLQNANGDDDVKQSAKLEDQAGTTGRAPKKVNKTPGGGGSGGTVLE